MIQKGAQFFLTLSNDGWFRDSYIVWLHFYNLRLRAVEVRKDMAVNSNYGISGLIDAAGRIQLQAHSQSPFVKLVEVCPNNFNSNSALSRKSFVWTCMLFVVSVLIFKYKGIWVKE